MFVLTFIHRAHSSGNQNIRTKKFDRLENVSKFLQDDWYDDQFIDWDGCEMPTKDEFSLEKIEAKLGTKLQVQLFGPYTQVCCLVPDEIILSVE